MRAKADGYTLLFNPSIHVINPLLMEKPPYRTVEDFTEISLVARGPLVLVVTNGLEAKSVKDLIGLARRDPKSISFATSVIGSASHLAEEMFKRYANVDILIVPYKGNAPALTDLIGGQVSAMMDPAVTALPMVRAGKLRALAVTSKQRLDIAPDIPTVGRHFIAALKDNRLVALSEEDKVKKRFVRIDELDLPEQTAVQGWL